MRKLLFAVLCLLYVALPARAQNYLYATGSPAFSTQLPIDQGFVNVNNGEIHLEIPLATKKQRGDLILNEALVYDSRIWHIVQNGSSYSWQPTNVPNGVGGWTFSSGASAGTIAYSTQTGSTSTSPACGSGSSSSQTYTQYTNWTWIDPGGTSHAFPGVSTLVYGPPPPNCTYNGPDGNSSSSGSATDGSGYVLTVTNNTTATITDLHGITYQPTLCAAPSCSSVSNIVSDRNGNSWSSDSHGNLIDTSGQTPVLVTTAGNITYYDVLGVNGARKRYKVTTAPVYFNTLFLEQGVTEVSVLRTCVTK
jgi:hypothetical protein